MVKCGLAVERRVNIDPRRSGKWEAGLRRGFVRAIAPAAVMILFALSLGPNLGAAAADGYRLDTGDVLRITVFGEATYPLDVSIDDSGSLTLPLLGEIGARGKTTAGLVGVIADAFRRRQLIRNPFVQVAIQEYRPFFISGAVARPGAYPYKPGMTVRHALAIAGGFKGIAIGDKAPALTMADLKSDQIAWVIEKFRYEVQRERLKAELADQTRFIIPDGIPPEISPNVVAEIIDSEEAQMSVRRSDLDRQIASIGSQLEEAKRKADFLHDAREKKEKIASHQLQELESTRTLRGKALVTQSSLVAAETAYNNSLADTAQIDAEASRQQQDVIEIADKQEQVRAQRRMEIIANMQMSNLEIAKAENRIRFIREQLAFIAAYGEQRSLEDLRDAVKFTVHRADAPAGVASNLGEDALVQPGDVISVSITTDPAFYRVEGDLAVRY